jgi:cell division transport system permease protein
MRALRYAFDEALASLWRGRDSGLLSTATIALALFVLGGFLLVTANLERLGAQWSSTAELSVYVTDEATPSDRKAIEVALAGSDAVSGHEFVSKSDALARFKQTFGDLAPAIDDPTDNPLPASFEAHLRPGPGAAASVDGLAATLRQMPGVADVRYDRQWLNRLLTVIRLIRGIGLALGTLLAVAAALTVANVVRLALYARHDELDIMHLVGAPPVYVRGPFVMEGILQGGAGALTALVVLAVVFFALRARYLVPLAAAVNLAGISFLSPSLCILLVVGGMAVGCLGGLVAAWNR